uniref:Geranylgeranyl transferase type-2 subunit alpha n=1 Tax=Ditylenchus dipsaci TaxID=166011 RepID=A0A915EQD1_9BILA
MHFVKRTPANEVHDAIEARKRSEKLKAYMGLTDQIFVKREKGELDDELLCLTAEVLKKNPDIYTFWGIRREVVEVKRKQEPASESSEEKQSPEDYLAKIFNEELSVTKEGLFKNPKSYGAWHHRYWACANHPKLDFQKELGLCEKALSMDPRNFHVWDHRRSIAKLAKHTNEDELCFSDELIERNPSNYSAWHYRGTILPKVRPDLLEHAEYKMPISEECLKDEFEKTLNICCLNSEDQTAWTYCRWLCEAACDKVEEPLQVVEASFHRKNGSVQIVMSQPVNKEKLSDFISCTTQPLSVKPVSDFNSPRDDFQCVRTWLVNPVSEDILIEKLEVVTSNGQAEVLPEKPFVNKSYLEKVHSIKPPCRRTGPRLALENVVNVCKELMRIEDDNPWEVIALARTEIFLNGPTLETLEMVKDLFNSIKRLDPQRIGMYEDLLKKVVIITLC